jgi:hypothetical protein
MDRAWLGGESPGGIGVAETSTDQEMPGPVYALFQRRVAGDDALLMLAGLRFA